jgi:signal transduction histidine kinase
MESVRLGPEPRPSRGALLRAVAVGAALLLLFAAVFANARAASWVAERSAFLSLIQTAQSEAQLAQAQLAQAILLAVDYEAGLTVTETLDRSIDDARRRLGSVRTLTTEGTLGGDSLATAGNAYTKAAFVLLDEIANGKVTEAKASAQEDAQALYEVLATELAAERQVVEEQITQSGDLAGTVADISALLIALLLPATVILAYRGLARRQLRQATLEAQLAAERELGQTKDEFIANISHELRTPLTGISGFAHVLEDTALEDPETALELVNLIIAESGELSRMVDDLLTVARDNAGVLSFHLEAVDVRSELESVVQPFERFTGRIPVLVPPVGVVADPIRFRQVFRNLVANARHHGGPAVRIECRVVGSRLACSVIDDGNGVPPELEERLFERYVHRGEEPLVAGSLGLGLAIVRLLTREMGGDVVYDRHEEETWFTVSLPLAEVNLDELAGSEPRLRISGTAHA